MNKVIFGLSTLLHLYDFGCRSPKNHIVSIMTLCSRQLDVVGYLPVT